MNIDHVNKISETTDDMNSMAKQFGLALQSSLSVRQFSGARLAFDEKDAASVGKDNKIGLASGSVSACGH